MALTKLQRDICRLISRNRIASGESYLAGGVALNEALAAKRISNDIDLFHDTGEALRTSWEADRRLLEESGFRIQVLRERPTFVEVEVAKGAERVRVQWACDSAYRFFPLLEHAEMGLVLHPFDLATNKVLALVGRLEARDWIDVIHCDERIQPLGYLAWAATGKDPGFSPAAILEQAGRSSRYTKDEILALSFDGEPPDPALLSRRWHEMLDAARAIVGALLPEHVGKCVLEKTGKLYRGDVRELRDALQRGELVYHAGRIRGAFPRVG
jgi:hypothetical protein